MAIIVQVDHNQVVAYRNEEATVITTIADLAAMRQPNELVALSSTIEYAREHTNSKAALALCKALLAASI